VTRRARPLVAVVALSVLLLAGCGIPGESKVTTLGPGPSAGTSNGTGAPKVQYGREDTLEPSTFVKYYLEAAAGDPDTALKRAKAFMSPAAATAFQPQVGVRVVHLVDDPPLNNPGSDDVTLKYQVVGILNAHGELDPAADDKIEETTLTVADLAGRPGLFLSDPPPFLMITDDALESFYDQRPIYFWNTEHTGLVPDIRYMPLTVPPEQAPTMIMSWLINGPAQWLANAAEGLPEGTEMPGIIPATSNDTLQITLNDQAVPADEPKALDRLRRQLQWSLRPWLPKTLELRIGKAADPTEYSDSDYLTSNFADHLAESPERFVIFDGRVRRLADSLNSSAPIPVATAAANKSVVSAALSSSGAEDFAALVVSESGNRQALRVGWAPTGTQAALHRIALTAPIGHPSWAVTPDAPNNDEIGLVSAHGALYSFTATGHAERVDWESSPLTGVTDVAIAPDGHRVVVLAGGRLYLSVLTTSADGMQLSDPTQVSSLLLDKITAVDWSSEGWLAVAGFRPKDAATGGGRAMVMDMSLDGVQSSVRVSDDLGDERVSYLSAYPANPTSADNQHSNFVSYVVGNDAYDALQAVQQIKVNNLDGTVPNPPAGKEPMAPFFLR
jgi:hypothetical protein